MSLKNLQVDALAGSDGLNIFRTWIQERYQEVEVSKIAESLTAFFKRLRRQAGQTIREFNSSFDRSHSRLIEIDCRLPEVAKAWAYLNALSLSSSEELALLASVGNEYNVSKLQRAAVLHEKSIRPPWQPRKGPPQESAKGGKGVRATFMAGVDEGNDDDDEVLVEDEQVLAEDEAIALHEAYVAQETAKAKYREIARARGVEPSAIRDSQKGSNNMNHKNNVEDQLANAKARSYCAGCGRRGHWHRDSVCPLNKENQGSGNRGASAKGADHQAHVTTSACEAATGVVQVAYEVGDSGGSKLYAITDTACSKSVMGQGWLESYLKLARNAGVQVQFVNTSDDFRFGASKLFRATYTATILIEINEKQFAVRAAVVDGEVPLLLSRKVLSKLGMVYDVAENTAKFKNLNVGDVALAVTDNGHPAIIVNPRSGQNPRLPSPQEWADDEVKLLPFAAGQYVLHDAFMTCNPDVSAEQPKQDRSRESKLPSRGPLATLTPKLFYPNKINPTIQNLLCATPFNLQLFSDWWGRTPITKDFWIETSSAFIRVHVVPRRGLFDPGRWDTDQDHIKRMLLDAIREVRITSAMSCKDSRELLMIHDTWRSAPQPPHPVLWVGRTIFSRAPASTPTSKPPTVPPGFNGELIQRGSEEPVADEQGAAPSRGHSSGDNHAPYLEHRRSAAADRGQEESGDRLGGSAEGSCVYDKGPVVGGMLKARDHTPDGGHEGAHAASHPGRGDGWEGQLSRDVRASCGQTVPGGTKGIPGMVRDGDNGKGERRLLPGPGQPRVLCGVGAEQEDGKRVRSGGQSCGATSPGRCLSRVTVGIGVVSSDRCGEVSERERGGEAEAHQAESGTEASTGDGGRQPHASGTPARGEGRDRGVDDTSGDAQGPLQPLGDDDEGENAVVEDLSSSEIEFEIDSPPLHALPGARGEDATSGEIFYECQEAVPRPVAETAGQSNEQHARELLGRKDFSFKSCESLLASVCYECQSRRKRKLHEGTCSVAFGGYSHGNHYGVIKSTYHYWYTTKYVNAFMKFHGAKGQWSSVQLCFNCHTGPHKDAHNLGVNWAISFGDFEHGRLWLERCENTKVPNDLTKNDAILSDGSKALGYLVETKHQMTKFDPKTKHAVEQWSGTRCSIIAYTTRGLGELSRPERDVPRSCGFPLGKSEGTHAWEREHEVRPKKSIRRNLWKGARRASSLLTLGLAAASSYITETIPVGKPPHQACLLEIGEGDITLDVLKAGFHAIEPVSWDDYTNDECTLNVSNMIENFKPNIVWFQGNEHSIHHIQTVMNTICQQLEGGGLAVYQALQNDPVWDHKAMKYLTSMNPHSFELQGDVRVLRIGDALHKQDRLPGHGAESGPEVMVSSHDDGRARHEHLGASAIHFEKNVPKHVQSALTRLHQNLGHPKIVDLVRHLRFAGADESVIKACKGMRCDVCDRNQRTGSARPGVLPSLLDMNQVVSIDVFTVFDSERVRHEFLSVIDHATTFHLVCELNGHSGEDFCRQFTQLWGNVFGAPGTISADLESGLQVGVSKYAEFHGCRLRSSAGQAHWQQGVVERHGYWYQEILQRVIDEKSITKDDMYMAVQAVNTAKNELRRRHGFSPSQAVFGKDPKSPEELDTGVDEERFLEIMSGDQRRQREVSIRASARMAFFRTQVDSRFRRGMIQRARVKRGGYAVGELVCFYRIEKIATKRGQWRGPGTIIGHEGGNWWVSLGGRCHLVAEEHLRPATSEELGELFSTRVARDDLERLLELDPDDPETFDPPDQEMPGPDDPAQELPPVPDDDLEDMEYEPSLPGEDLPSDMFEGLDDEPRGAKRDGDMAPPVVPRRVRQKTPGRIEHSVNMLKRCQTERALEKQLEKEIPWKLVPPEEHAAFRAAEQKQIQEHYDHDALEPLSVDASAEVKSRVHGSRILSSRFAYRDKHWSRRKIDATVPWKHKARLVVSGHRDPDIPHLETDAPTIGRLTILTLFQVVASRRKKLVWMASAGDITAAFLNGDPLERELYLRQPKGGVQGLHPDQIFKVKKGIFGLPDSPRKWWRKLRRDMTEIKIDFEGQHLQFSQCPLDPCLFQLCDPESRKPLAHVGVHVDDLLVVGPRGLVGCIKGSLSRAFPVDGWEDDTFEYIGSHVRVSDEGVFIGQESYASSRLFEVEVARGQDEYEEATEAQRIDNQSLIGALSWLSAQTRPDLQCSVSLAQQLRRLPLSKTSSSATRLLREPGNTVTREFGFAPWTCPRWNIWYIMIQHGPMHFLRVKNILSSALKTMRVEQ